MYELSKEDRELIESLAARLEDEGALIEDIEMEATPTENPDASSAVEFSLWGRIERIEDHDRRI